MCVAHSYVPNPNVTVCLTAYPDQGYGTASGSVMVFFMQRFLTCWFWRVFTVCESRTILCYAYCLVLLFGKSVCSQLTWRAKEWAYHFHFPSSAWSVLTLCKECLNRVRWKVHNSQWRICYTSCTRSFPCVHISVA